MAILKGFPPSNTIQLDAPSKRVCEMCGKEFWQSFPLGLCLDISNQVNFDILPCRECWSADQGKKYWGTEVNKWGDEFTIYSQVREGYSTSDIEKSYLAYREKCKAGTWPRIQKIYFIDPGWKNHLEDFETFYEKIVWEITEFNSAFRHSRGDWKRLEKDAVPKKLTFIANHRLCRMFWRQKGWGPHHNPRYFGIFRRDGWMWYIKSNEYMPDMMNCAFMVEDMPAETICQEKAVSLNVKVNLRVNNELYELGDTPQCEVPGVPEREHREELLGN